VFTGSLYIFGSVGNIWSRQSILLAPDGAGYDCFGVSVGIYDTTAIIGTWYDDDRATDAGINQYELAYDGRSAYSYII
jgi:hypothetical protein